MKKEYSEVLFDLSNSFLSNKISELINQQESIVKEKESLYFDNVNLPRETIRKLEKDLIENGYEYEVVIYNNIKSIVEEYCKEYNLNKSWIAEKLNMSKQALSEAFKSNNPRLETLIKFSILLDCDINELFKYELSIKDNSDIS